ncbi:MAG: hypothetical protein M1820_001114 [Bogoriella megaspora]|nr:MAG: hypothetical protein M1820_001114 [Bogoriella megaspora]
MASESKNPLLEALPPATDYLTYLTIIEYNLTPENLPILHNILQDANLTTNIGWDLIHLIVPLLPASEQCLQDIAKLGNPREVILKVTESLRLIDFDSAKDDTDNEDDGEENKPRRISLKTAPCSKSTDPSTVTQAVEAPPEPALPVLQFLALLSMLGVLHPRIKTKYPSRFLSTSLQAILASYSQAGSCTSELTPGVIQFVKALSGTKRPQLPARRNTSQSNILLSTSGAPDPEGSTEAPDEKEAAIQRRLLQSFLTHLTDDYISSLASREDIPGLALCSRIQERLHPEWTVPNRTTMADKFAKDPEYLARATNVGQLVALSQDLNLDLEELYTTLTDSSPELAGHLDAEDDPPSSAEEIPLSRRGAAFLLAARQSGSVLYDMSGNAPFITVFPAHAEILQGVLGSLESPTLGSESPALLDAVMVLALLALENNQIGEPSDDEHFNQYLQRLSLISAQCPSPNIRYHAYYLTSTILRSHPSDKVRLAFIRDTLEHCPLESLKASAVSWLKGEILEANSPLPNSSGGEAVPSGALSGLAFVNDREQASSLFASPIALSTLSTFLFPDLTYELTQQTLLDAWTVFKSNVPFYLAALNLYKLLLSNAHLSDNLDIGSLHKDNDIGGSYLFPLKRACQKFQKDIEDDGAVAEEEGKPGIFTALGEISIVLMVIEEVEKGVTSLNKAI